MANAFERQGFNLMAFGKEDFSDTQLVRASFQYMADCGANFVNIDWMVAFDDDGHRIAQTSTHSLEPTQQRLESVIALAHEYGLEVSLKPHLSFPDSFENRMDFNSNAQTFSATTMLADWAQYMAQVGAMASKTGVGMVVVGTEMAGFDRGHRAEWEGVFSGLRGAFAGRVAYDALYNNNDWHTLDDGVVFWDLVDTIGLSLYVPLSSNDHATRSELNAAWLHNPFGTVGNVVEYLHGLSVKYGKPVMALESGFQSIQGGLVNVGPAQVFPPQDNAVQAAGIGSLLDTFAKYQGDWFGGVSLWSVYPHFMSPANTEGILGYSRGYMTNGKPAAQVIQDFFTRAVSYTDKSFAGDAKADHLVASYANDSITGGRGSDYLNGGAGNDLIYGDGQEALVPGPVTLKIVASGAILNGEAIRAGVEVNGVSIGIIDIGETETFQNEGQAWNGPNTYEFQLPAGVAVESLRLVELNWARDISGHHRNLYVSSVSIDAVALSPIGTMTTPQGQTLGTGQAIYSDGWLQLDASTYNVLVAQSAQDDDTIDGGPGIDTAGYSGAHADYTVTVLPTGMQVHALTTHEGLDTLTNVERLHFSDTNLAFDLVGNAGDVVKILGAVFGPMSTHNATYAGIGIALMDGGMSYPQLMSLALELRLGAGYSNEAEVALLYEHLVGTAPSPAELAGYSGLISSGVFSQTTLALVAADSSLNLANVGFTGLQQTGLAFSVQ